MPPRWHFARNERDQIGLWVGLTGDQRLHSPQGASAKQNWSSRRQPSTQFKLRKKYEHQNNDSCANLKVNANTRHPNYKLPQSTTIQRTFYTTAFTTITKKVVQWTGLALSIAFATDVC